MNSILNSSYLDLLFQGREKNYGAYELRLNYDKRAKRSVLIVSASSAILLSIVCMWLVLRPIPPVPITCGPRCYPPSTIVTDLGKAIQNQIEAARNTIKDNLFTVVPDEAAPKNTKPEENNEDKGDANGQNDGGSHTSGQAGRTGTSDSGLVIVDPPKDPEPPKEDKPEIFESDMLDIEPEYPGGEDAFIARLNKLLVYPEDALEKEHSETVWVDFVVDETGKISNVKASKGQFSSCKNEAERVMKMMPLWKPAKIKGKAVACYFKVPIRFQVDPVDL